MTRNFYIDSSIAWLLKYAICFLAIVQFCYMKKIPEDEHSRNGI
jgi:hypothetical protein